MNLTRRQTLLSGAALPLGLAAASPVSAVGHTALGRPTHRNFNVGDFKVTTLLAGQQPVANPHSIFGLNVDDATFEDVSRANFISTDEAEFFFTPTVVNTGSEVILFDTGQSAEGITTALAGAGYAPTDVTHVVITHMHGDHIGGLTDASGNATFVNVAYVTGQVEYDDWATRDSGGFEGKVRPLADRMSFIGDGDAVRSGITGVATFGHTAGHMGYMLESGGQQLFLMADVANHYVWSLAYPEWEVRFDMDKAAAAATRKKVLGMAAADRIPLIGYHMPFPGLGYVETRGEGGYHFVPHSYQLL